MRDEVRDARRGGRLRGRRPPGGRRLGARNRSRTPWAATPSPTGARSTPCARPSRPACERFVLASSCAVYGDAAQLPIAETAPPRPLSPYADAKLASEERVRRRRRRRAARRRLPALLQRLRAAAGPGLGVLRRHQPLSRGRGRRRAGDHLRRRRARRATSCTSATWSRPSLRGAAAAAQRRLGAQRRHRPADRPAARSSACVEELAGRPLERRMRARARGRHPRTRGPTPAALAGCSAGRRGRRWPPASRETWAWFAGTAGARAARRTPAGGGRG